MGKYIVKRIGFMLIVLVVLSFLMFMIYNLVPNNRAYTEANNEIKTYKQGLTAAERDEKFDQLYKHNQRRYGTDTENIVLRYLRWVGLAPLTMCDETCAICGGATAGESRFDGLLQGNFGYSYEYRDDVINIIGTPMKNTIFINIFATLLALGITIPLGIFCSVKKNSVADQTVQVVTIIGYSIPTFIISILFIWIFCSLLGWLPPSGMKTPGSNFTGMEWFLDRMKYMILPLIVMTFSSLGGMTRYVRASMIDALTMDCIKTARAKGLREKVIIFSHAWRNALIPIVTLVVGWFLGIFGGSVVIEEMFGLNGMGKLMIDSLRKTDFDVVMFMQMFYVFMSLAGNLIIDIIYGLVDPRVRVNK